MTKFSSIIPGSNPLRLWLLAHNNLETPRSFLALTALSAVGASLKRSVWFDQEHFKVYPNINVLLVGPSGIGKDVAVDRAEEILNYIGAVRDVGARTIEAVYERLARTGDPACGYILMPEITAYIGKKDYQKGFVQDLTDLLSTKEYKDYNTKKGEIRIKRPTLTCMAGSTLEWLQREMPEGSTEGGFFPRFIIVSESEPALQSPLPKHDSTKLERDERQKNKATFLESIKRTVDTLHGSPSEILFDEESMEWYRNWYHNRFRYFSPVVRDYANRSRDQVLRLAMISAILRGSTWINMDDCRFASGVMRYIAESLEDTVIPMSSEKRARRDYLLMLAKGEPLLHQYVTKEMLKKHDMKTLESVERSLLRTGDIVFVRQGRRVHVQLKQEASS